MTTANVPYDRTEFFRQVIRGLNLEVTSWRLHFFEEWARGEGTGAGYNPLATTWPGWKVPPELMSQYGIDSNWNDNGGNPVKNYVSFEKGVIATVETLKLDYYPAVRASLAAQDVHPDAPAQVRTWGTLWFADFLASGGMNAYEGHETMVEPGPAPEPKQVPTTYELWVSHLSLNSAVLALEKRVASVETDRDIEVERRAIVDRIDTGNILGPVEGDGSRIGYDLLATLRRHSDRINELDAKIAAQNLQIERLQGTA